MYESSNMQCKYNSFIQIMNFHGLFRNALRCRKLVPAEYWCPYGTNWYLLQQELFTEQQKSKQEYS